MVGEINYPNIKISPADVKMHCISNFASDYKGIVLKNISPLSVQYHWELDEERFIEEPLETTSVG